MASLVRPLRPTTFRHHDVRRNYPSNGLLRPVFHLSHTSLPSSCVSSVRQTRPLPEIHDLVFLGCLVCSVSYSWAPAKDRVQLLSCSPRFSSRFLASEDDGGSLPQSGFVLMAMVCVCSYAGITSPDCWRKRMAHGLDEHRSRGD